MYQKDYIMRMIEELGIVLAALLGFREKGQSEKAVKLVDETLSKHFDVNISHLLAIPKEDFLIEVTDLTREEASLNMIAEMLFQYGLLIKDDNVTKALKAFRRSLLIFFYLDAESNTYNLTWQQKIDEIDKLLKALDA